MIYKKVCLLIETTSPQGSLGLYSLSSENTIDRSLLVKEWKGPSHSAHLTSAFELILDFYLKKEIPASVGFKSDSYLQTLSSHIAFIALGVGPGRFTGVRVGVSFAKTLAFLLHLPIYPVSSLKILAQSQIEQEKPILVLLNAFKNSVYKALYQKRKSKLEELIPPSVVLPKDIAKGISEKCVCVGDGYSVYKDLLSDDLKKNLQVKENIFPKVEYLASLLKREVKVSHYIGWKELKPVYLRSPVPLIDS